MAGGWIKLHRCLMDSVAWGNPNVLKVWMWCLLKATHRRKELMVGTQIVNLCEGQFVFGRRTAAEELDMKESTVWKYMKLLEKAGNIKIKSNNKFSVVTVEKWGIYQSEEVEVEQQDNNHVTTTEQPRDTNKKDKKDKKDNNRGFVPPTVDDVRAYVKEKGYTVDAETFVDFYTSKGWMVGKSKMKDWKACVRTWAKNRSASNYTQEVKPKRYKEFEPVKEIKSEQMPDEMRKKLGGMFNYE